MSRRTGRCSPPSDPGTSKPDGRAFSMTVALPMPCHPFTTGPGKSATLLHRRPNWFRPTGGG
jgi:hypothetical protein